MANLNRLKVVLAEQQKTGKWLAEQKLLAHFMDENYGYLQWKYEVI